MVRDFICSLLPATLDSLQFAYRQNWSTDNALTMTLHTTLSPGQERHICENSVKLHNLCLNSSLCSWILNFQTGQNGQHHFNLSDPQHRCTPGLFSESPAVLSVHTWLQWHLQLQYIHHIFRWLDNHSTGLQGQQDKHVKKRGRFWHTSARITTSLNINKKLIVDFRKQEMAHIPITINSAVIVTVEIVKSFRVFIWPRTLHGLNTAQRWWTRHNNTSSFSNRSRESPPPTPPKS